MAKLLFQGLSMDLQIMLTTVIALMIFLSGIWLIIQLSLISVKENQTRMEKRMDIIPI